MVGKGLKLLKFELDIGESVNNFTVLAEDTPEGKAEARDYLVKMVAKEKGDNKNIYVVGVSDMGNLNIITPRIEILLKTYFAKEIQGQTLKPGRKRKNG